MRAEQVNTGSVAGTKVSTPAGMWILPLFSVLPLKTRELTLKPLNHNDLQRILSLGNISKVSDEPCVKLLLLASQM